MATTLKGKDILAISDWSKNEIDQVLDLAFRFKRMGSAARNLDILRGKSLLLLWFRRSTRTWVSFTWAMQQLGGFVNSRDATEMHIRISEEPGTGGRESVKDTASVLDRYVDALGIRLSYPTPDTVADRTPQWGDTHAVIQKFADYMKAPVLNMSSDLHHPTQTVTDMMTMIESLGDVAGKKSVLMWAYSPRGEGRASGNGFPLISATYGMNVTIVHPEGYDLDPSVITLVQKECNKAGTRLEISHDPKAALEGADVIYPRNWRIHYYGSQDEERRLAAQYKNWRLTESLLRVTNNARFMHTMPFDRGYEVDASVADGPNAIIYEQAGNLLHVRKAFLALLLADDRSVLERI